MNDETDPPSPFNFRPAFPTPEDQKLELRKMEAKRLERINDLVTVLNSKEGARLFQSMMIEFGVFEEKLATNSTVYINSAFRAAGLKYYNMACEISDEYKVLLTPPYREGIPYDYEEKA